MNNELIARCYELATFALEDHTKRDVGDDVRSDLAQKIQRLIDDYLNWPTKV